MDYQSATRAIFLKINFGPLNVNATFATKNAVVNTLCFAPWINSSTNTFEGQSVDTNLMMRLQIHKLIRLDKKNPSPLFNAIAKLSDRSSVLLRKITRFSAD